ncbi:hypothetical protein B0H13DRAFT_2359844 [Mycena leptocephala]|nr:hypothetical protein B0H13DRAFT_2359844 [Mycena leptocephala]
MIPRPRGTAGNDYSTEVEMQLGDTADNHDAFKGIQRTLRDLVLQARINWEVQWSEVSAASKAQLYAVARERHPYLARFTNDWATEEIVKQYIKNKRRHAYKNGWLEPPAKFEYLKANSAKRSPSAPRGRKSKQFLKKTAPKDAKKSANKKSTVAKVKAKGKKVVVDSEEEDDDGSE